MRHRAALLAARQEAANLATLARSTTTRAHARRRHPRQQSERDGIRGDLDWRRPSASGGRPEISSAELLRAAQWIDARSSERKAGLRGWTDLDAQTTREVENRAWCFGEVQALTCWSVPSWISLLELPRRAAGFERFLGLIVRAYRGGAVGLFLSYEEAMAMLGVGSRSTWASWQQLLEARGLIRCLQTWRQDSRRRCVHGRILYRPGPALEDLAGLALVEGAIRGKLGQWARRVGAGLRRRARDQRRERKGVLWQRCRGAGEAEAADVGEAEAAAVDVGEAEAAAVDVGEAEAAAVPSEPAVAELAARLWGALRSDAHNDAHGDDQREASQRGLGDDEPSPAQRPGDFGDDPHAPIVQNSSAAGQAARDFAVGSSISGLYSAPVPGADRSAPRRRAIRNMKGRPSAVPPSGDAPALAVARQPDNVRRPAYERPTESSPTTDAIDATALDPAAPASGTAAGDPEAAGFGGGPPRGLGLLERWLADVRPGGAVRAAAAEELRRRLAEQRSASCPDCGDAGGSWEREESTGPRDPVLGWWHPCPSCKK